MDITLHCEDKLTFNQKQQEIRAFVFKNYTIEPHNHDFYEINIILHGNGEHQIEHLSFDVKPGDVFIIPPMIGHAYCNTRELDVYHILLKKDFLLSNQKESANIPGFSLFVEIEPFLRQHFSTNMFLHLSNSELLQLKNDLSIIEDNNIFDTKELLSLKKHTVWKILYWFSSLLYRQVYQNDKKHTKYTTEIVKVLDYIHHNFGDKITVESLCKTSFLSRSTFLRSFFEVCKCTPMEYVNRYRCEKAVEMLNSTNMSKTEIAHHCGFYDLSHMKKTIKHIMNKKIS